MGKQKREKIKPVVLIILDGWGVAPPSDGNAISISNTPNMDKLLSEYPHGEIAAYGKAVGLEEDEISGSETAHENIGAGRIVEQDSLRISESIEDGSFFSNAVLLKAIENLRKKENSSLHLMGLLSGRNSPHSKPHHLRALLELAKSRRVKNVYLHLFTDGRDSPPKSAKQFLGALMSFMEKIGLGEIATIGGRFYAMDRSKRWDRLMAAYNAIVLGKGEAFSDPFDVIEGAYKRGISDEFIPPAVMIDKKNNPVASIKNGDSVIFFHLRSDRARQFSKLFVLEDFNDAKREIILNDIFFVAFTNFGPDLPVRTAFPSIPIKNSLTSALKGLKQLYIAEMEKFAHVTYFLNGGYADPVAGEARIVVQSDSTPNYKDNPRMSAKEVANVVINNLKFDVYDFITVNFANLDMVGHTGFIPSAVKACEEVDCCIGKMVEEVLNKNGTAMIIGDHGNAEEMLDPETGKTSTSHSRNPVPIIIAGNKWKGNSQILRNASLSDIAPTVIDLFGRQKPKEMTGKSLLEQLK